MAIDPAAKKPARIRRNFARTQKGQAISLSSPLVVNGTGGFALHIAGSGGLHDSSGLGIKLDTASGLVLGGGGVKIGILTTKGDLFAFGTANARLAVGADGTILIADSTAGDGIKWGKLPTGTATLTAGTVTVADVRVTANTIILLAIQKPNAGTPGFVYVSARVPATSFTITSSSILDTSTVGYLLLEP